MRALHIQAAALRALSLVALGAASLTASCSAARPATEMVIEVDGDFVVQGRTRSVRIVVYGRSRPVEPFAAMPVHDLPYAVPVEGARWGPIVVLAPEARDPMRSYRVVAIALDDANSEITRTSLISGYIEGVTLRFRLYLQSSCEGVVCTDEETCRDGGCVAATINPVDLVDAGPRADGGGGLDAPGLDAPGLDAPGLDAPSMADGGPVCGDCDDGRECTIDRCAGGICTHDVGCDDFVSCTVDACAPDDTCMHTPMASLCTGGGDCATTACDPVTGCSFVPDSSRCADTNPCTEDSCQLVTGCMHMPVTGLSCDDGVFCNGLDTCIGGGCAGHAGPPCTGATTCSEGMDRCLGCATAADCPAETTSAWSGCVSTGTCSAERSRTVTNYACGAGAVCVPSTTTELDTATCTATLNGSTCGSRTCTPTGSGACGGFTDACDETGSRPRTCNRFECALGSCATVADGTDSEACGRSTTGTLCSETCGSYRCTYGATCASTGTSERTCSPSYCSASSCALGSSYNQSNPVGNGSCNRSTDGTSCAMCAVCIGGLCGAPMCGMDAGPPRDAGSDAPDAADAPDAPEAGLDAGCPPDCCMTPALCLAGETCCPGDPLANPVGCAPLGTICSACLPGGACT